MKNFTLIYLIIVFLNISCKKTSQDSPYPANSSISKATDAQVFSNQVNFAKILAKAISKDSELRSFLKEEALKKFDNDHDILYHMVKDRKINNSHSFHERLLAY